MLYITTRDKYDAQTAIRTLVADCGSDGGFYIPFQMTKYSSQQIAGFADMSFGQCVAEILNQFFACRITGIDVDFAIGRSPVKLAAINNKTYIAESWRNLDNCYSKIESDLARKICGNLGCNVLHTSWLRIAIRIAVLFGIFADLQRAGVVSGDQCVDVAVPAGDFSVPMAVWYARDMGLPIGNIICSCNENSGVWDLLHLGEFHTDVDAVATTTPLCDVAVALELERLIHATLGTKEAVKFAADVQFKHTYRPTDEDLSALRAGMFSAVVSRSRLDALIPSVFRTYSYIMGPYTALAYSGLMDYRAKTGENRTALLLAERSPICDCSVVADAMRVSPSQLQTAMDRM